MQNPHSLPHSIPVWASWAKARRLHLRLWHDLSGVWVNWKVVLALRAKVRCDQLAVCATSAACKKFGRHRSSIM
jgi:hypothetical protein